jgi:excisionase family DNA binding protein
VAECVRVAPRTVRRWIKAGDLVVHRVGGIVRVAEGDLRAFLALYREGNGGSACHKLSGLVNGIRYFGNTLF